MGGRDGDEFDAEEHVLVLAAQYLDSNVHDRSLAGLIHVGGPEDWLRFHALHFPLFFAIV